MASTLIDRVTNPSHTGDNRCLPCTAVNVVLAGLAAFAVGWWWPALGAVVLAVGLATIWLRGYLIPGTPQLTKRYLPERTRKWFDESHGRPSDDDIATAFADLDAERDDRVDAAAVLAGIGVTTADANGVPDGSSARGEPSDDRHLRDPFVDSVADRIDRYRTVPDGDDEPLSAERRRALAALFEVDPASIADLDRSYPAVRVGHRVRRWPSELAMQVDLSCQDVLAERSEACADDETPSWYDVPVEQRVELLESIRALLERCPACDGSISTDETTVESCCFAAEVHTLRCRECERRLLEFDPEIADSGAGYRGAIG
ncbi:hypothetical protein [Halovivax gelatinilyticus]|uniref:hypothetical protein n=1 Tax=Halovivax gelatinilyticus TaxID=2961597 RepID=UPI0020CA3F95|nr:hypothetical protein [Halovivax gelatinilyticus]